MRNPVPALRPEMKTKTTAPDPHAAARPALVPLVGLVLAWLALLAAPASADLLVCGPGAAPGDCQGPRGVAVDREDGLLYVADDGNQEVDVFDADTGAFLDSIAVGASLSAVAVDNDLASAAHHDVYVFDTTNDRVLRYHPDGSPVGAIGTGAFESQPKLAIGPGGVVHVLDNVGGGNRRLQKFSPAGAALGSCSSLEAGKLEPADKSDPTKFGNNLMGFAVDTAGNVYLANAGGRPIQEHDPACGFLKAFHPSFNISTLALDAGDGLYVADSSSGETATYHYDPAGALLHVLYGNGTQQRRAASLAPYTSANGDLFLAEASSPSRVVQIAPEPPGPVVNPLAENTKASPIANTSATLNSLANPEGKASTYRFQFVDQASYESEGGFASPNVKATAETALPTPSEPSFAPALFRLAAASGQIGCPDPSQQSIEEGKCLKPETTYRFRAIATNPDAPGGRIGPESSFTTKDPFELLATWASHVGTDAARLGVEANPLNIPLSAHLEWVSEETCSGDEEALGPGHCFDRAESSPQLDLGEGVAPASRTVQLHSLSPDTAYRYRVVLENAFGAQEAGPTQSFTTFAPPGPPGGVCPNDALRIGPSAALPDCRAYEMVSPVDKEGGEIVALPSPLQGVAEHNQSAATVPASGSGLTYSSHRAFGAPASAPLTSQYLAHRGLAGWSSEPISPPREGPSFVAGFIESQFKYFDDDLSSAWLLSDSEPPLSADAIPGFANLYRRDNVGGTYQALCPREPAVATSGTYIPKAQGGSADGSTVVLRANEKLTADASDALIGGEPNLQVYVCEGGELRLVSVLPPSQGGIATDGNSSAGSSLEGIGLSNVDHRRDNLHNAVSVDGLRIYWSDAGAEGGGPGRLFLRKRPLAAGAECSGPETPCTVEVSEAVGAGGDKAARFWTASPDGSRAIFAFSEGPLAGNLYAFEAQSGTTTLIAEGVSGLAGWSEDATKLYFVSTKALAAGAAAGQANLYLDEVGVGTRLVATLQSGPGLLYCRIEFARAYERCSRATADGERLLFASNDPLTGYDNVDAVTGKRDGELFLYDAEADEGAGELICVSCNPSGGRPAGGEVKFTPSLGLPPIPIAAWIPGWETSLYASRVISADGRRVFFDALDALVPEDTNGAQDVYQWQRPGKGECDTADRNYFPANGGCLSLISSGKSPRDSEFLDASADGSDVFFRTESSLWPADPGLIDVYDARIKGGFPPPASPRPPCEGEACQSPPPAPSPAAAASASFRGAGNESAAQTKNRRSCPKGKRRVLSRGKPRCVRRHRSKRHGQAQAKRRSGR